MRHGGFDLHDLVQTDVFQPAELIPKRLIPFDTYNMFYRDGLEKERLEPLRAALMA